MLLSNDTLISNRCIEINLEITANINWYTVSPSPLVAGSRGPTFSETIVRPLTVLNVMLPADLRPLPMASDLIIAMCIGA